jgi:hypothetical protein
MATGRLSRILHACAAGARAQTAVLVLDQAAGTQAASAHHSRLEWSPPQRIIVTQQ